MSDENFDIIEAGSAAASEYHHPRPEAAPVRALPARLGSADDEPEDAFLAYGHSWFR